MSAATTVLAVYKPRAGLEEEFEILLRSHYPTLNRLRLVTDSGARLLKSPADGTYLELFEWLSEKAIGIAHESAEVKALWGRLEEVAQYSTLSELQESTRPFARFEHVATL